MSTLSVLKILQKFFEKGLEDNTCITKQIELYAYESTKQINLRTIEGFHESKIDFQAKLCYKSQQTKSKVKGLFRFLSSHKMK